MSRRELSGSAGGALYAIGAYTCWGVFPVYFHALGAVPPLVILCHRIVGSALFMLVWIAATGRLAAVAQAARSKRVMGTLLGTTLLIASNWLVYIGAVAHGQVLEASLGYFINPLVTVALAAVFLRERLSWRQKAAVGLAFAGVAAFILLSGVVPTISLVLAGTFAVYGLLRKRVGIDAAGGLFIETALLFVPALGYLALAGHASTVEATRGNVPWLLLALAGPITALPLLWFANAARRLPLAVLGFVQYISPTLQLACAVLLFGERFTSAHALTFALIWTGVALFVSDSFRQLRAHTTSSVAR